MGEGAGPVLYDTVQYSSSVPLLGRGDSETSAVSSSISHTRARHQIIAFVDGRLILQIYKMIPHTSRGDLSHH